jgi:hypothetical protein
MRKEGDRLIIAPAKRPSLLALLATLLPLDEDFPPTPEPFSPSPTGEREGEGALRPSR